MIQVGPLKELQFIKHNRTTCDTSGKTDILSIKKIAFFQFDHSFVLQYKLVVMEMTREASMR